MQLLVVLVLLFITTVRCDDCAECLVEYAAGSYECAQLPTVDQPACMEKVQYNLAICLVAHGCTRYEVEQYLLYKTSKVIHLAAGSTPTDRLDIVIQSLYLDAQKQGVTNLDFYQVVDSFFNIQEARYPTFLSSSSGQQQPCCQTMVNICTLVCPNPNINSTCECPSAPGCCMWMGGSPPGCISNCHCGGSWCWCTAQNGIYSGAPNMPQFFCPHNCACQENPISCSCCYVTLMPTLISS